MTTYAITRDTVQQYERWIEKCLKGWLRENDGIYWVEHPNELLWAVGIINWLKKSQEQVNELEKNE